MKTEKKYAVFATFKTTGRESEMTLPMSKKEAEKALSALKEKSAEFKKLNFKGFKIKAV
jgi:uncharacterized protein YdgA (DUF945 family)